MGSAADRFSSNMLNVDSARSTTVLLFIVAILILSRPESGRGSNAESSDRVAALARLRDSGCGVDACPNENLGDTDSRFLCRLCSVRCAGRCASYVDCVVYPGGYGPSAHCCNWSSLLL